MKSYFIPALFLVGTLFFAYLYIVGPSNDRELSYESKAPEGKVTYNRLQNLRQQTAVRVDLEKQKALLNQSGGRPELEPGRDKENALHKTSLEKNLGPAADDVDNRRSHEAITIDQRLDEFLAKRQAYEEMEQAKRELYVESFIKEARAMGFAVKVDDNMKIVSVKKLGRTQ